ncbi:MULTISPECIES: hypothetical protein [Actinomycetes]|uniref:hypothetical protein n=1 Tax=Actinomycetes TaxID=1760 RepID=UPI00068F6429|nr:MULTISPECIES: hypothetical protein [Actinomycetes]
MSMPDPADDRSRLQRARDVRHSGGYKTTTLLLSSLLIGAIILGAIYAAVSGNDDGNSAPPPAFPQGTGQPSAQPAPATELAADAFGIPTTDSHGRRIETPTNPLGQVLPQTAKPSPSASITDPDAPLDAPKGLMWQRVNGTPLGFSTSDGPTSIDSSGVPAGFSHTPQGAVLAIWQIFQRAAWGPGEQTQAVLRERAVVTAQSQPVVDRMINGRDEIERLRPQLPAGMFDVPIAVKVSNYDTDYAHIQIAVPASPNRSDGVIAATYAFDVVWRDGTWKWVVPNDGADTGSTIVSLGGWSQW